MLKCEKNTCEYSVIIKDKWYCIYLFMNFYMTVSRIHTRIASLTFICIIFLQFAWIVFLWRSVVRGDVPYPNTGPEFKPDLEVPWLSRKALSSF